MSIFQCVPNSFKLEMLQGLHDLEDDTLYIALYEESASLGPSTTAYTATGEATGTGYTAGGQEIAATLSQNGSEVELVCPDVTWSTATITARGALIYNTSKSNRAVCIINFGQNRSKTAADFVVDFPAAGGDYPVAKFK